MSELNLDDYQAQRVRALTSIMQEVVKNEVKPDPEEIAKLFGLDKLIQKGSCHILQIKNNVKSNIFWL